MKQSKEAEDLLKRLSDGFYLYDGKSPLKSIVWFDVKNKLVAQSSLQLILAISDARRARGSHRDKTFMIDVIEEFPVYEHYKRILENEILINHDKLESYEVYDWYREVTNKSYSSQSKIHAAIIAFIIDLYFADESKVGSDNTSILVCSVKLSQRISKILGFNGIPMVDPIVKQSGEVISRVRDVAEKRETLGDFLIMMDNIILEGITKLDYLLSLYQAETKILTDIKDNKQI